MGNKQQAPTGSISKLKYSKFIGRMESQKKMDFTCQLISPLFLKQQSQAQGQSSFEANLTYDKIYIVREFKLLDDLQAFVSNILKISKMLELVLFDQLKFCASEPPYTCSMTISSKESEYIGQQFVADASLEMKIDFLQYVALFLSRFGNIYLEPSCFSKNSSNQFQILNFQVKQTNSELLFLAFMKWSFGMDSNFQKCYGLDECPTNLPIYLQQIYTLITSNKLKIQQLEDQLKYIKNKMVLLNYKTDSFYACSYYNKTLKFTVTKSSWIFLKMKHQLYFFNVQDQHPFTGKIIRKKKKKDIHDYNITFDPEDLEILYVPDNSKYIVKATEFEYENWSSISDIEIKYILPIKMKNCLIHRTRNGDIFLLQNYVYRFHPPSNKLLQQSKRIVDYIFLTSTKDSSAFIIKLSIDILKNGIRIFYKNEDKILAHAGDKKMLEEISSLRIDIRHVIFCIEVYRGVFVMMASKNMWILDLNFQCYFSYATPLQLKRLTSSLERKTNQIQIPNFNQFIFDIENQSFKVQFPPENNGCNAVIKQNKLHIIGVVQKQPYYLQYEFIHRIGSLRLKGYQPLFVLSKYRSIKNLNKEDNQQKYSFNFHEQNSSEYKYGNWILKGEYFVKIEDFSISFDKSNYEVALKIEETDKTLKQHLESYYKQDSAKFSRLEIILLLYRLFNIFSSLYNGSITHRNISINHLVFTASKELKLHGWLEPAKNWHVSDYKDYLLVCLNIICLSTYEKISQKWVLKHDKELSQFPEIKQKIQQGFKQAKTIEKKSEIEKNLQVIKSFLEREIINTLHSHKSSNYLFSPEFQTPRLLFLNIETQKLFKITIVPEETQTNEFVFNHTDQLLWDQLNMKLFIFTASNQFYELKIDETTTQKKMCLQQYEYLPMNIASSTFALKKGGELFSFGGYKKQNDGKSSYNMKVFKFNWKTLSWQIVTQLIQPRIKPQAIPSICGQFIYLFGGYADIENTFFDVVKFDTLSNELTQVRCPSSFNISSSQNNYSPMRIFHLNSFFDIFVYWSIQNGDYVVRYISYSSIGFSIELRGKNFSTDNILPQQAVAYDTNTIHILRSYGKFSKIIVNKLDNLNVKNETLYAI